MKIESDIHRMVKRLANEKKTQIPDQQLFLSPEFKRYGENLLLTVDDFSKRLRLEIIHDEMCSDIAMTNGNRVFLNTANEVSGFYESQINRFEAVLGILLHEGMHIRYLDFNAAKDAENSWRNGELYGELPMPKDEEESASLTELIQALENPTTRPLLVQLLSDMDNFRADGHDEYKGCQEFGGLVERCITMSAEALRSRMPTLEVQEMQVEEKQLSKLALLTNLTLQFIRYGEVLVENDQHLINNEYIQCISNMATEIDSLRYLDDPMECYGLINRCVLTLWPYIKESLDEIQQEGQNQPSDQGENSKANTQHQDQSGTGNNYSESAIQTVMQQLQQAAAQAGKTKAPENRSSSKVASSNTKAAQGQTAQQPQPNQQGDADATNAALNMLLSQLAQQAAESEVENAVASQMNVVIQQIDQNSSHKGRTVQTNRHLEVRDSDVRAYDEAMCEIRPYVKTLTRKMQQVLKTEDEDLIRGKPYGKILDVSRAYRPDRRYFADKKLPGDYPDLAISVLVDQSGSMRGERIEAAMKASLMLYEYASGIHVPIAIAGHHTTDYGIQYHVYADYQVVSKQDRYRIMSMSPRSCNRDGMAIEIAANLLAQRPEETKLLIIISDGQPNDTDYGGSAAAQDIREIVAKYRRKGVLVYAAAIGSDKDRIQEIYRDGFLDITDLSKLPLLLTKLVEKRVIKR